MRGVISMSLKSIKTIYTEINNAANTNKDINASKQGKTSKKASLSPVASGVSFKFRAAVSVVAVLFTIVLALTGCDRTVPANDSTSVITTDRTIQEQATPQVSTLIDPSDNLNITTESFAISDESGTIISADDNEPRTFTISSSGNYIIQGLLENGQVVVNIPDTDLDSGTVKLILKSAAISCTYSSPIAIVNANKVDIEAAEGTYNIITDCRDQSSSATSSSASFETSGNMSLSPVASALSTVAQTDDYDGAIYAACDLKISGNGTLVVESTYDNGIKTKDDLKIKSVTLKVTAPGNALKGNDSVTVESGQLILISTESDGIKTSSSDVSNKGNQHGSISINGGQSDIYAAKDGISAAYDAVIADGATINIFTAAYSDYDEEKTSGKEMYLIVPKANYSASNDYYAYFYHNDPEINGEDNSRWIKCTFETMVYSGRSASYYGLKFKIPAGYTNVRFCVTKSGAETTIDNVLAASSGGPVNDSMNAFLIKSISSGTSETGDREQFKTIDGDWVMLSSGSSNSNKTTFSAKGIKAYNEVIISGGIVNISCSDDGIHANNDTKLENGSYGKGNITVSGGVVTIKAADDGMHADNDLTIKGGTVNINESYEGLEGNTINIDGGSTFIYSKDDGVNACRGTTSPLVSITGGYLDVTTPSGDTDGIDSNGSITVSGGFTIVKGGSSQGNVAGSIDVDGSIKVTGGTVVALGGICETPGSGSVNTYISSGTSFSAGNYSLTTVSGGEVLSFTLAGNYSSIWIASDGLALNGQYKLTCGSDTVLEWTQSSTTVGSSRNGWGGGFSGGSGGHGGPGRP